MIDETPETPVEETPETPADETPAEQVNWSGPFQKFNRLSAS